MLCIRKVRQAKGITQEDLATMAGCSRENISRYESGTRKPPVDVLGSIATALGCKIDDLLEKEEAS